MAVALDLDDRNVADLRLAYGGEPAWYDPDPLNYGAAQRHGAALRMRGVDGVRYDSVRAPGGICHGVFRPAALIAVHDASEELAFLWNGSRIESYEVVRSVRL